MDIYSISFDILRDEISPETTTHVKVKLAYRNGEEWNCDHFELNEYVNEWITKAIAHYSRKEGTKPKFYIDGKQTFEKEPNS